MAGRRPGGSGGGGGRGKPPGAKRPVGGGGEKKPPAAAPKRKGMGTMQENEIKFVLDFVRKNPKLSYSKLERALRTQTGMKVTSSTINYLAVEQGVRPGRGKRPKEMPARTTEIRNLGPGQSEKLAEFVAKARMKPEERRLVTAVVVDGISIYALKARYGTEPKARFTKIAKRIGLYKFLDSLQGKGKKK